MRWVIWIAASLVVVIALITAIGYMLPKAHRVTRIAKTALPRDAVYAILTDVDNYPSWRPGLKSLARQPDRDGKPAWIEDASGNTMPFTFERMERASLLVTRITDPSLPFGGTWTYRIVPDGSGSAVTITEDGEVSNPIFRFMSRFVFGHAATLDGFVRDLEARAR